LPKKKKKRKAIVMSTGYPSAQQSYKKKERGEGGREKTMLSTPLIGEREGTKENREEHLA